MGHPREGGFLHHPDSIAGLNEKTKRRERVEGGFLHHPDSIAGPVKAGVQTVNALLC